MQKLQEGAQEDDGKPILEEGKPTPPKRNTPCKVQREEESKSEVEEVSDGSKGKKAKKKDGQRQKEVKAESSKAKPKVGVPPLLGRVRIAAGKK